MIKTKYIPVENTNTYEWCPNCEETVELVGAVKKKLIKCPNCGKMILPCSLCVWDDDCKCSLCQKEHENEIQ